MTALTTHSETPGKAHELNRYLRALAGPRPGARLLEIRFRVRGGGMGRVFVGAHSAPGAAGFIRRLARRTDVYVGVALRDRRSGGREAVDRSHLLFVEIDAPGAQERVRAFAHPPTMLVASGSEGHVHCYWALRWPVGVLEIERGNRRLAHHLDGDRASVDASRILRPPSSFNHKYKPPAPVRLLEHDSARQYEFTELVGGLPDPPARPAQGRAARVRDRRHPLDSLLLAIPAEQYVRVLAGREANRAGKVTCPFHDDADPSLQLYGDGSWYCFACSVGGTIYDFAARLWGYQTRGRAFLELRARLADQLGGGR